MTTYKLESSILTLVNMQRWDIVTKEKMLEGYKGRDQRT